MGLPVCSNGECAVVADRVAEHADLLRSQELQRQRLALYKYKSSMRENRQILHTVFIVKSAAVELLHV